MRILKATALFGSLLLVSTASAASTGFSDTRDSAYAEAIQALAKQGIVQGYDDGTYRPDQLVNRAEFVKILMNTAHRDAPEPADLRCFADLEVRVPQWYARPVCLARQLGVVSGYPDGTFRAEKTINLAEALKISMHAFAVPVPTTAKGAQWYEGYLLAARERGVLLPLLRTPGHLLTRGELAALVFGIQQSRATDTPATQPVARCGNGTQEQGEQCDDGNTNNGDGCSQLCIVVPEPVRLAMLQIDAQATGTIRNVSRGKTDVSLLKFTATAGRQDVRFTGVKFQPSVGSLLYGQRYILAVDSDGDGRYESTVANGKAQNQLLVFDISDGIRIRQGVAVRFEVRADIVSTVGPVSLGLQFATTEPEYVHGIGAVDGIALQGIETNNACPNNVSVCFIRVNTRASSDIAVQERGSLYVVADAIPARNQQVLAGSISGPLLRLRLRADGEDIDVHTIRFDGGIASIDGLLLFAAAPGTTPNTQVAQPFARATAGQCTSVSITRFCVTLPVGVLRIRANEEVLVVVAAKMNNEQSGAVSGQSFGLTLSAATDTQAAFGARGVSSLSDLVQNDGNSVASGEIFIGTAAPAVSVAIQGVQNDTVLAKISGVTNALAADAVGIPTGTASIGGFEIAASAHTNNFHGSNDVVLSSLTFQVDAQNVQLDPGGYRLFNPENPAVKASCSAAQATGLITVQCAGLQTSGIQHRIGQSQKATYVLEAVVTSSQITPGGSGLYVSLAPLGQRGVANAILWSDDASAFSWVDGETLRVQSTYFHSP